MSATDAPTPLFGLAPLADERTRILILGSFPSERSLARGEYYAHAQNHFWPIMARLFGLPADASYSERLECLNDRGVGIWDVIAECQRKGSLDSKIENPLANDLVGILTKYPRIRRVVFNGASPEGIAHRLTPEIFELAGVAFMRLPSTSPAHAVGLERKLEGWEQLKEWSREIARDGDRRHNNGS